ncbi:HNH endonuclease [Rhizobium sp. C4]|uniref:HNH endonuclease n=1 Tax=Rhizobium sp. C4 TaxID=1349800 RepID=UPI001E4524DA|nr:HNH endonuclease [Rhizobium sp. C4]MCD2172964.1 HNH endonuclease [Rhizobium sp. C4]
MILIKKQRAGRWMSFSSSVKKQLMVDSARRCCVCHRYKGVGVEVHHIIPRADGGEDSYDNGIVLCFDCHCAAGHYNTNHPRGTKFSPDELRGHKERWFLHVRNHPDQVSAQDPDHKLICRYYLTADRETAAKALDLDSSSPLKSSLWLNTPKLKKQFYSFCSLYGHAVQDSETDGYGDEWYESRKTLIEANPEFRGRQYAPVSQRMFDAAKLKDPFANQLIRHGAAIEEVASMSYFSEACGGSGWGIDFHTRRPYFVFAQILNLDPKPVQITSLNNQPFSMNPLCGSDIFDTSELRDLFAVNNIILEKEMSLSLFLGVIAGPIDYNPTSYQFEVGPAFNEIYNGDTVTRIIMNSTGVDADFSTCSQLYIPKSISYKKENEDYEAAFEELRPDTLFLISREWMCGSCPHLFGVNKNSGAMEFIKTLFDKSNGKIVAEDLDCFDLSSIIIAEFDNEISKLISIKIDGSEIHREIKLEYGDAIQIDVSDARNLVIEGFYTAPIIRPENSEQRRQKASKFRAYERELKSGLISPDTVSTQLERFRGHSS